MTKIFIIHSGIELEIIHDVCEKLQYYIHKLLCMEEVEVVIESYRPQLSYTLNSDEFVLLCSTRTKVDGTSLPKGCHVIPVSFDEKTDCKKIDSSLQNINYFVYDNTEKSKSSILLCEVILSKLGLIKNARKVFISYKRSETSNLAESVRKELLSEGYSVFLDKNDIDVGTDFMQEIRYSIAESDIFLMLNSETYYDSIYTKKELYAACISGVAIIVLSMTDALAHDLCGLPIIRISETDRIKPKEKRRLLAEIENARTKLWRLRHNRLNRKLQMFGTYEKTIQGIYIPSKSIKNHNSIFPIIGIPTTLDFQRIKQNNDFSELGKEPSNRKTTSGKVYAFYDNLSLPSSYSKHLDWLDEEMPNVDILKTSTIEKQFPKEFPILNKKAPVVFLSASVPNNDDCEYDFIMIHDIIVTLVEAIIKAGGTMVFGGHPTITPIVLNIMEIMSEVSDNSKNKKYPNIYLYQSRYFKGQYPLEADSFPKGHLKEVDAVACEDNSLSEETKQKLSKILSLNAMREKMIGSWDYTHAIFIGGRYDKTEGPTSSGIWKEYEEFIKLHKNAKCLYLEKTGVIPVELSKYYDKIEKTTIEDLPKVLCGLKQ